MPIDDVEKRLNALERSHDKLLNTLEQINITLNKFESHIDELFEVKTKLDSIDAMWRKVDDLTRSQIIFDKDFHLLRAEHVACKPVVDGIAACRADLEHRLQTVESKIGAASGFTSRLFESAVGNALWAIIGGGAAIALWAASKGAFIK